MWLPLNPGHRYKARDVYRDVGRRRGVAVEPAKHVHGLAFYGVGNPSAKDHARRTRSHLLISCRCCLTWLKAGSHGALPSLRSENPATLTRKPETSLFTQTPLPRVRRHLLQTLPTNTTFYPSSLLGQDEVMLVACRMANAVRAH